MITTQISGLFQRMYMHGEVVTYGSCGITDGNSFMRDFGGIYKAVNN